MWNSWLDCKVFNKRVGKQWMAKAYQICFRYISVYSKGEAIKCMSNNFQSNYTCIRYLKCDFLSACTTKVWPLLTDTSIIRTPLYYAHLSITDTSIIRTPLYYGQFVWSQKSQKSFIPYLYDTDTSVKWTLGSVPLLSVLKRFDCTWFIRSCHFRLCVFTQCFSPAP